MGKYGERSNKSKLPMNIYIFGRITKVLLTGYQIRSIDEVMRDFDLSINALIEIENNSFDFYLMGHV